MSYRFPWHRLSDEQLLDLRICDLPIKIKGSFLEPHIIRLYGELNDRGIRFKPHVWLSEEWFSPDGVPGIAIPFYLAHPRLMKLERKQMLEIEGGTDTECMRILRHEAGHASTRPFDCTSNASTASSSARSRNRIPTSTSQSREAGNTCCTCLPGTRRHIPRKTSRKHLPCG